MNGWLVGGQDNTFPLGSSSLAKELTMVLSSVVVSPIYILHTNNSISPCPCTNHLCALLR
jgi:hypothetical protein